MKTGDECSARLPPEPCVSNLRRRSTSFAHIALSLSLYPSIFSRVVHFKAATECTVTFHPSTIDHPSQHYNDLLCRPEPPKARGVRCPGVPSPDCCKGMSTGGLQFNSAGHTPAAAVSLSYSHIPAPAFNDSIPLATCRSKPPYVLVKSTKTINPTLTTP